MEESKLNTVSPLVLAYLGDTVYESYIREYVILKSPHSKINDLHKKAIKFVSAKAQADIIIHLEDKLTQEEARIFKRGRNQKKSTGAKNADIVDYRQATGFEALIGYLYLRDDQNRLEQIINMSIDFIEKNRR